MSSAQKVSQQVIAQRFGRGQFVSSFDMSMSAAAAGQRAQDASNARWEQFLAARAVSGGGGSGAGGGLGRFGGSWLGGGSGFGVGLAHGMRLPIGLGLTPALAGGTLAGGALYGIGSSAISTESSIANLRAIRGMSEREGAILGGQLGRVATDTPGVTRREAFQMATVGARSGVETRDLPEFTRVMGKLSAAVPGSDPEVLAKSVLQTMGAFRMATEELEGFGSALLALDTQAKATAPEILDITRRLAGVGDAAGMSIAEVMALSAAMRDAGLRPESGATAAMRLMMKQLANPDSRARIATALNITPDELNAQFNRSPVQALGSIVQGIRAQPEGSARLSFISDELGLNNVRDVMFMGLIGNQFDKISGFTRTAQAEIDRPQMLSRRAAIETGTTAAQFERLGAAAGDAANEIGSVFLPAIKGWMGALSEGFTALAEGTRGLKGLVGGIGGTVGGAMQDGIPLPGGGRMMTPGQAANAAAHQAQLAMLPDRAAAGPRVGPAHGTVSGALAWDAVVGRWRLPADLSEPPGGWGPAVIQGPQRPGMDFGGMGQLLANNEGMGQAEAFGIFAGQVGRNFLPGMFGGTEAGNLMAGARSLLQGAGGAAQAWQWERTVGGRTFAASVTDPMSAVQQQQVDILDSNLEQQQVNLLGEIKTGIDTLIEVGKAGGGGVVPAILGGLGFGGQ
jgi:TP901 family phage tail tape measure protein